MDLSAVLDLLDLPHADDYYAGRIPAPADERVGPLVQGLIGLSLAEEADPAEAMLVATLHRRSAEKLGLQPERIFDAAAGRTDLAGARWLRDARDTPEQPEDAGWIEDEDADGFRYGRAHALRADLR